MTLSKVVGDLRRSGKKRPLEPRNKHDYFPLYWLFNRDPHIMVY